MKVAQSPDRTLTIDDKSYLYFGGTSYLGLPNHNKFKKILTRNIIRWGTTYGSSRNSNIQLTAYDEGEAFLSEFIKSEAALTVSSGMLAGKLVIETLTSTTDHFYHFPGTHSAIKAPNSLAIFVDGTINPRLTDEVYERIAILTDAVPSSDITAIDLSVLSLISKTKKVTLVIDESHSLGILGENGCGLFSTIDFPIIDRKIMLSSLGKAMGLTGGVIASDIDFIAQVKLNSNFVSSAGMNPAFVQSIADAKAIYKKQHKKLLKKLDYLNSQLIPNDNYKFDPRYPVIYPEIPDLNSILEKEQIIITHFAYPNLKGELYRIVLTANHKKKDLDKIVAILNQ
ncbi:aminotransferase class I/II-fold pyridoxal phosphate-dependent enzyme [Flavobacterium algicola]|uniref:aminotransferase class I/II-fold pyridoxal phosphate-dependent enzyme n=1 Tax=Flavobacterium algicola TaxID=556529 RepID=UPI001EFC869D|nr:aminotransferase class I/II-fold pyridoxal phosphate-dependent enzyme [Flavobacterium algicola]MCG9793243.1 aminotransferase class I/II-fold pyridoxal phosphate-dependent enzyme [Flavobacterium algicola]